MESRSDSRSRSHVHSTPTYSSWLNPSGALVWTHHAARHGPWAFRTVRELVRRIEQFVAHYNAPELPSIVRPPPQSGPSKNSTDFYRELVGGTHAIV